MDFQYQEMGSRIRLRRRELKLKQKDLAIKLGISTNHMSAIESGRQKPSLDTFIGICQFLNVTPDYLLLGALHACNAPLDIYEKLQLCDPADVALAGAFIELLVQRSHGGQEHADSYL